MVRDQMTKFSLSKCTKVIFPLQHMDIIVPYACITISSYRVKTGTASRGPRLTKPHFTARSVMNKKKIRWM